MGGLTVSAEWLRSGMGRRSGEQEDGRERKLGGVGIYNNIVLKIKGNKTELFLFVPLMYLFSYLFS